MRLANSGKYSAIRNPGTDVAIEFVSPPVTVPGFGSNVSN